jgi:alpha-amylase
VPVDFWAALTQRTGVYTVGEVFIGDIKVVAPYQGPLSAPLSYPLFYTLRNVFGQQQSATQISAMRLVRVCLCVCILFFSCLAVPAV